MNRILLSLFFFCSALYLQAASISWMTGVTGDWDEPTNWVGGVVPGAADIVTISDGDVTVPASVTAVCDRLSVGANAFFTIAENASFTVAGSTSTSFVLNVNGGGVINEGTIEISATIGGGIRVANSGILSNTATGNIDLYNIGNYAFQITDGSAENFGAVNIHTNVNFYGIYITGDGDWEEDGTLTISDTKRNAILLGASSANKTMSFEIKENGIVDISKYGSSSGLAYGAVLLSPNSTSIASLVNKGQLDIYDGTNSFGYGIYVNNSGLVSVENNNNATITVDDAPGYAFYTEPAAINTTFTNENGGSIEVTNGLSGVRLSRGEFYNNGLMEFSSMTNNGISSSHADALFENQTLGEIQVNASIVGINLFSGTFTNNNEVTIDGATGRAIGVSSNSTLNNATDGVFTLTNNEQGLNLGGTLNNHGLINSNSTTDYNGFYVNGTLNNFSDGVINSTHGGTRHLAIYSPGVLDNQGTITLNSTSGESLYAYGTSFSNSGIMNIQNTGSSSYGATFAASVTNESCGEIYFDKRIRLQNGTTVFTNDGWILSSADTENTGTVGFENNGVLEDNNSTFATITTSNTGYMLEQIPGDIEQNVAIPNALSGTGTGFTITNNQWYTDPSLTVSGGTYNPATNEFTPSVDAVGLAALYMELNDSGNGCSKIYSIEFENPIALPIELLDFMARSPNDKDVELQWWSLTEENMSHFNIQHSVDGKEWVQTSRLRAAGNSINIQNYAFTDVDAFVKYPDVNSLLYRLEMVEFGGLTEYSLVRIVETNREVATLTLFPNPVSNDFHIVPPSRDFESLQVFDVYGLLIKSLPMVEGKNSFSASELELPQGVYNLVSTNGAGIQISQRMIVAY